MWHRENTTDHNAIIASNAYSVKYMCGVGWGRGGYDNMIDIWAPKYRKPLP